MDKGLLFYLFKRNDKYILRDKRKLKLILTLCKIVFI